MNHVVLTIGRTFGSGGRLIGKKVADACGMTYYDKELLEMAAKESGMSVEVLEHIDESASNSLLYTLSTGGAHFLGGFVSLQSRRFLINFILHRPISLNKSPLRKAV